MKIAIMFFALFICFIASAEAKCIYFNNQCICEDDPAPRMAEPRDNQMAQCARLSVNSYSRKECCYSQKEVPVAECLGLKDEDFSVKISDKNGAPARTSPTSDPAYTVKWK